VAVVAGTLLVVVAHAWCRAASPMRVVVTVAALLVAVAAGVAGFALTQGGDPDAQARYGELLHPGSSASLQERRSRWGEAWRGVRETPLGAGLGTAGNVRQALAGDAYDVRGRIDSSYVKVALEQGVVLVLLLAALATLLVELVLRGTASPDPWRAAAALGGAGALVAMLVLMYAGVYAETTPAYTGWLLTGLGAGALLSGGAPVPRPAPRPAPAGRPARRRATPAAGPAM
jgi:O-antigen ligase